MRDRKKQSKTITKKQKKYKNSGSFAIRLNGRLLARQFAIFLLLDLLFCALFSIALFYYMERGAAELYSEFRDTAFLAGERTDRLYGGTASRRPVFSAAGFSVEYSDFEILSDRRVMPSFILKIFPPETRDGVRGFSVDAAKTSSRDRFRSISYDIYLKDKHGGYIIISAAAGEAAGAARLCLFAVFICQVFMLVRAFIKNSRDIERTLRPLRELSEAAQALSAGPPPTEALQILAGTLKSIDAAQLDTRISINSIHGELRPLAKAINEMLARVDASYQSQVRFVSDASHELRTPIAVIQGYANLLSRWGTEDPETLRESIGAIKSEADSMKDLVNQLLFLARGDGDSIRMDHEALDLSAIASEVMREVEMIDPSHNYTSNLCEVPPVMGDAGLIKQLLRILMDNSMKYTAEGGAVTISSRAQNTNEGEQVCLSVQDEGSGIPTKILPFVFDRFYRADESRARNTGGAGLGLSIAKWIAERHGGYMEIVSGEGVGTRITVVFPK